MIPIVDNILVKKKTIPNINNLKNNTLFTHHNRYILDFIRIYPYITRIITRIRHEHMPFNCFF